MRADIGGIAGKQMLTRDERVYGSGGNVMTTKSSKSFYATGDSVCLVSQPGQRLLVIDAGIDAKAGPWVAVREDKPGIAGMEQRRFVVKPDEIKAWSDEARAAALAARRAHARTASNLSIDRIRRARAASDAASEASRRAKTPSGHQAAAEAHDRAEALYLGHMIPSADRQASSHAIAARQHREQVTVHAHASISSEAPRNTANKIRRTIAGRGPSQSDAAVDASLDAHRAWRQDDSETARDAHVIAEGLHRDAETANSDNPKLAALHRQAAREHANAVRAISVYQRMQKRESSTSSHTKPLKEGTRVVVGRGGPMATVESYRSSSGNRVSVRYDDGTTHIHDRGELIHHADYFKRPKK